MEGLFVGIAEGDVEDETTFTCTIKKTKNEIIIIFILFDVIVDNSFSF